VYVLLSAAIHTDVGHAIVIYKDAMIVEVLDNSKPSENKQGLQNVLRFASKYDLSRSTIVFGLYVSGLHVGSLQSEMSLGELIANDALCSRIVQVQAIST